MLKLPITPDAARVLVTERQPDVLRRYAEAVQADGQLLLAAAVSNGAAAMSMMHLHAPDVVVVDLQLEDVPALAVVRYASWKLPRADIVVLTRCGNDGQVLQCIEAGATAYLFKDRAAECLAQSIHLLRKGSAPMSPGMAQRVLSRLRLRPGTGVGSAWTIPVHESTHPLTACEAGILRWIARGMSLEQIGALAGSPPLDVLVHIRKIYGKLAAHAQVGRPTDFIEPDTQKVVLPLDREEHASSAAGSRGLS